MANTPQFGLGADALRAWLKSRKAAGLPYSVAWLAKEIDAGRPTVHAWLQAGTLKGGSIPDGFFRERIAAVSEGKVPANLFAEDELRREQTKRAVKAAVEDAMNRVAS